jgi:hypothetical protein
MDTTYWGLIVPHDQEVARPTCCGLRKRPLDFIISCVYVHIRNTLDWKAAKHPDSNACDPFAVPSFKSPESASAFSAKPIAKITAGAGPYGFGDYVPWDAAAVARSVYRRKIVGLPCGFDEYVLWGGVSITAVA